jgi:LAO/AO transport system kinase
VSSPPATEVAALLAAGRGGDKAAVARLLSLVERGGDDARSVGRLAHGAGGHAHTIGVTGSPGAGKSTLVARLVGALRRTGERVGVLAVDPTSPFSGGAILGDRVRMDDHVLDDRVFIRSMASRGHLGGLAMAAPAAVRVLDATGHDRVLLETVGVGQVEIEVAGTADTTVVVVTPGWGDGVQAAKAGIIEIADVFVVNKADRPGLDQARRDLEQVLDLAGSARDAGWRPPVLATVATTGVGVDELVRAIDDHRAQLTASGEIERRRQARLADELVRLVAAGIEARVLDATGGEAWAAAAAGVTDRTVDPWTAADTLIAQILR